MGVFNFGDKHIDSKRLIKDKSYHLVREENLKISEKTGMVFVAACKERGIKIQYDISYGGHPHELRYTEFFGNVGGIYSTPCCGRFFRFMLSKSYDTSKNKDYSDYIHGRLDKYILHHYDIPEMECSALLPGSNLLRKTVDKRRLNACADLGGKIKPHPLTNEADLERLRREYKDQIIPEMYSGFNVMMKSKFIFGTGASELSLYAMLLNKFVIDMSNKTPGGGYYDLFAQSVDYTDNQKARLNWILNHPGIGVFMPDDYETTIPAFLDWYQAALEEYRTIVAADSNLRPKKS